jgi:hypothetical protein
MLNSKMYRKGYTNARKTKGRDLRARKLREANHMQILLSHPKKKVQIKNNQGPTLMMSQMASLQETST